MIDGQTSDGYHTFDELYEHRNSLYLLAASLLKHRGRPVWRSRHHHDGSAFDGWFILGVERDAGSQITYHLPLEDWDNAYFAETLERAPEWDNHTPQDVVHRLRFLQILLDTSDLPRPDEMAMPFYGPQECEACGEVIIRASLKVGGRKFSPPEEGERYPNAWHEHTCEALRSGAAQMSRANAIVPVQESDKGCENATSK